MTGRNWATANQKQMPSPIKKATGCKHQPSPTGASQLPVSLICSQGRSAAALRPRRLARDREHVLMYCPYDLILSTFLSTSSYFN